MIGFLKGRLAVKQPPMLMVDVNGVGYEMEAPMSTFYGLPAAGEAVALFTHLVVREDAHILYAFGTDGERRLFRGLLKVSGVGPKIALATLAVYDAPSLRLALADGDVAALTRVPGIGKRGAERLVLELRDKIGPVHAASGAVALNGHSVRGPVVEALVGLGFAVKQAEEATDKVLANEPEATTSNALRAALSILGKK